MPTVVHFEIPADNVDRAKNFYSDLFGWEIEEMPETDYWLVVTSGEKPVNGGIMKRQNPEQKITNYIDVSSVEEYITKVNDLGGTIVVPKTAVPEMGYFAICLDTENNVFGLWESDESAR